MEQPLESKSEQAFQAAMEGNVSEAKAFLKRKPYSTLDETGRSLLHWAAVRGNAQLIRTVVKQSKNHKHFDINLPARSGWSPLHFAASHGHEAVVMLLLRYGADPNSQIKNGSTPLHAACCCGNEAIARLLLDYNSDVNATDNVGVTPLSWAALHGKSELCELLLSRGARVDIEAKNGKNALDAAAYNGHSEVIDLLCRHGMDVNHQNPRTGATALHWAAQRGNIDTCETLVSRGAQVNFPTKGGGTVLHWAAMKGKSHAVSFLVSKGADINALDTKGRSLLHFSAMSGEERTCDTVLGLGLNPLHQSKEGTTALHLAAQTNNPKVVARLLDSGADLSLPDSNGVSPLHIAAMVNDHTMCKTLIKAGASVNATTNTGETPLSWASKVSAHSIAPPLRRGSSNGSQSKNQPLCNKLSLSLPCKNQHQVENEHQLGLDERLSQAISDGDSGLVRSMLGASSMFQMPDGTYVHPSTMPDQELQSLIEHVMETFPVTPNVSGATPFAEFQNPIPRLPVSSLESTSPSESEAVEVISSSSTPGHLCTPQGSVSTVSTTPTVEEEKEPSSLHQGPVCSGLAISSSIQAQQRPQLFAMPSNIGYCPEGCEEAPREKDDAWSFLAPSSPIDDSGLDEDLTLKFRARRHKLHRIAMGKEKTIDEEIKEKQSQRFDSFRKSEVSGELLKLLQRRRQLNNDEQLLQRYYILAYDAASRLFVSKVAGCI